MHAFLLASSATAPPSVDGFSAWRTNLGKRYESVDAERLARANYLANDALIHAHNSNNNASSSFILGHNHLSDLAPPQYASRLLGLQDAPPGLQPSTAVPPLPAVDSSAEPSVDWQKRGAVTHIKDQNHPRQST